MNRPLGGVGASLLLQLVIADVYASDPSRSGNADPEVRRRLADQHGLVRGLPAT